MRIIQGIMVFYSVEYVQDDLKVNAFVLGSLTFLVGILFFLEDCFTVKDYEIANKIIQTEKAVRSDKASTSRV